MSRRLPPGWNRLIAPRFVGRGKAVLPASSRNGRSEPLGPTARGGIGEQRRGGHESEPQSARRNMACNRDFGCRVAYRAYPKTLTGGIVSCEAVSQKRQVSWREAVRFPPLGTHDPCKAPHWMVPPPLGAGFRSIACGYPGRRFQILHSGVGRKISKTNTKFATSGTRIISSALRLTSLNRTSSPCLYCTNTRLSLTPTISLYTVRTLTVLHPSRGHSTDTNSFVILDQTETGVVENGSGWGRRICDRGPTLGPGRS
ncbi:hypothetical protein L209DRAFT_128230 [Thermothelomyces heterothallicus CBS 203.75]